MKTVRIGEVCEVVSGATPKTSVEEYWNGTIPWVTPAELTDESHWLYETERCLSDEGFASASLRMMPVGTVLLSTRAPIGKTAIVGTEMCCNQGFKNMICSEEIDCEYLYRLLKSNTVMLQSLGKGATFKELSKKDVERIVIPLPSINEQQRCAERLQAVEGEARQVKLQQSALDKLVKSRFVEMFGNPRDNDLGWMEKPLGEVCETRLGKMLDAKKQTGEHLYPYLANANVQWFRFDLANLSEMDFVEADRVEFELRDGDVLATEGGEVGRCAVWHCELENCYFQKAIHRIRCNPDYLIPDYFVWAFKMKSDYGLFDPYTTKSTIAHLTGKKIKQVPLQLPPLTLQREFAAFVQQVDKLKFETQCAIDKLQMLYDSLAQEYFSMA